VRLFGEFIRGFNFQVEAQVTFGQEQQVIGQPVNLLLGIILRGNHGGKVLDDLDIAEFFASFIEQVGGVLLALGAVPVEVTLRDTFVELPDPATFVITDVCGRVAAGQANG